MQSNIAQDKTTEKKHGNPSSSSRGWGKSNKRQSVKFRRQQARRGIYCE